MQPKVNGRFASLPLEERLKAKIQKSDGCWLWVGHTSQQALERLRQAFSNGGRDE